MKRLMFLCLILITLTGCFGYSALNSELVGQVKKIRYVTPLLCLNRVEVDVSLGILRNGMGSMSGEDLWLVVEDPTLLAFLKSAVESGKPVKILYDSKRLVICPDTSHVVKSVEWAP